MASKRRNSLLQRDFIPFIFGGETLTLSRCLPIYDQLEREPGHVSSIISDDDLIVKLLSNFDLYASRMARFFTLLNHNAVSRARKGVRRMSCVGPGIADELIENILFPLLGEEFEHFQLHVSFLELFAAIIDFSLPYHPRPLEALAKRLQENEQVLIALVAGQRTSAIMQEWIGLFKTTIFGTNIIAVWTRRLISQCKRCESDHGILDQIDTWQKLEDLIGQLTSIAYAYTSSHHAVSFPGPLGEGGGTTASTGMPDGGVKVPTDFQEALKYFGIISPTSERLLSHVLGTLEEEETMRVLLATVRSFPCRPCYETALNPSAAKLYERHETEDWGAAEPFLFSEILGPGIGIWRILVSAQAMKDMEDAHIQGDFVHVQSKLVELASGDWLKNSLCSRIGRSALYLAEYPGNGGMLWQTDIEFDEESHVRKQLIKIWRIGDVRTVLQAVRQALFIHKTYPPARLDACNRVSIDRITGKNIPVSFHEEFEIDSRMVHETENMDEKFISALFQFNKFYMVTQSTMENLLAGNTGTEYPLTLSQEELDIIKNSTTSTLILGRSGTGKTTCLIYKLFGRYIFANRLGTGRQKRQVLLTRSSVLSHKLAAYTKRLISTQDSKGEPTKEDGVDEVNLIGQDEREVHDTVFSIKDQAFPLVCTFNHFMKILENTIRAANRKDFSPVGQPYRSGVSGGRNPRAGSHRSKRLIRRPQVVDFEVFSGEYWPSFPTKLTKNISPTLAFMEIIGVIKGAACRFGKSSALSRDEYRERGYKISPVDVDRDILYDIYQHYERQKVQFSDVDDIDRARSVLEAILGNPDLKRRIEGAFDEIYVDEIQDQRLMEIMMLLHLIKSPHGIHFGGDTAQAISKDSVFRFAHLKDLVYQRFSLNSLTKPYELYKNYRTHQGILSVATRVMRQLIGCFPLLVDRLPDEVGQLSGPKPTVFVGLDEKVFSSSMFGAASLDDDDAQFGAEQVIIVRDFVEKKKLKDAIGDFALILTVMESKGMEFEDVLLYDFLTTSKCISDYRALANLVDFRMFDGAKHIALCSELKQLYVAITRAQNRLWFFENNETNLAPMLTLWVGKQPIVEVAHAKDPNIKHKLMKLRPGTNANPGVWSAKGYEFIHKQDYENALFCFRRSKDSNGTCLANAFIAEKKGKALLSSGDEGIAEDCFRNAIDLFQKCGHLIRAASCYETIGMPKEAADIFSKIGEFGRAGDLFNKLDMFENAASNYSSAERYDDGASTLARGNLFDTLVYYLNDHGNQLDSTRRLHYSRLCNLLLRRGKISPALRDLTLAALRSDSEKEDFFKEYEMTGHLLAFYIDRCRYSDACSLVMKDGNLDKAWEIDTVYGGMSELPQQQRIDVFNYTQARRLLASLATAPNGLFPADSYWSAVCPWLSGSASIQDFWGSLPELLNELLTHKTGYDQISFRSPWMKQIFDFTVTLKAATFVRAATNIAQLPIESINEALGMAKEMIVTRKIPLSLLILLRISMVGEGTKPYVILESSPLLDSNDGPPWDAESTARATIRWTLVQVCSAVDEIDNKAKALHSRADPCVALFSLGRCRWPVRCGCYHEQITSAGYAALMTDVLRVNSMFCHVGLLYRLWFGGLAPEGVSQSFRPRRRRWLESLLARVTYISSFENDPSIVADVRRKISQKHSPYFGLSGQLENMFFYRLKDRKEWEQKSDFSSLLEQLQLAAALGVPATFEQFLGNRASLVSHHSRHSWGTLQRIRYASRNFAYADYIRTLDKEIAALETHEMYSYHAVCSLYEKIATFLIYKSHPTDFLLPNSWVELYLLQNLQDFTVQGPGAPQGPMFTYREALLSLLYSFCNLIRKLEADTQFRHKISGRERPKAHGHKAFIQRNVNFLATCLLSAFSWRTSQPGQGTRGVVLHVKYGKVRANVLQAFGASFAHSLELLQCRTDYDMAKRFIDSFDKYAGKDYIRLIKATRNTVSFFGFLEFKLPKTFLASLHRDQISPTGPTPDEPTVPSEVESIDYIQSILPAAKVIQRMWRTRYNLIQERRQFFKSPSGQAILFMRRVCQACTDDALLGMRERIRRKGLHFSEGLDVYFFMKSVEELFQAKKTEVQRRIEDAEAREMEIFQLQWERVSAMRERVSRSQDILLEPNWHKLDLPSQELKQRYEEAMSELRILEMDLNLIDCTEREVAAAEAIQNMWRMRYPIIQKRRVFFSTPDGQAMLYMHRMYNTVILGAPLHRMERIRSAAVLFREGVEIHEYVRTVERLYLMAKNTIRSRVTVSHGTGAKRVGEQWDRVCKVRDQVRRKAGFLSEKNWGSLAISSGELQKRFSETLEFLKGIENEIYNVMDDDGIFLDSVFS